MPPLTACRHRGGHRGAVGPSRRDRASTSHRKRRLHPAAWRCRRRLALRRDPLRPSPGRRAGSCHERPRRPLGSGGCRARCVRRSAPHGAFIRFATRAPHAVAVSQHSQSCDRPRAAPLEGGEPHGASRRRTGSPAGDDPGARCVAPRRGGGPRASRSDCPSRWSLRATHSAVVRGWLEPLGDRAHDRAPARHGENPYPERPPPAAAPHDRPRRWCGVRDQRAQPRSLAFAATNSSSVRMPDCLSWASRSSCAARSGAGA